MCGIFGVIAKENKYHKKDLITIQEQLGVLSQVRGRDSSGIVYRIESLNNIRGIKGPVSFSQLTKSPSYKKLKKTLLGDNNSKNSIFSSLGHARLVTNGSQLYDQNNQPVEKNGIIGVHNGIIVNVDNLWKENKDLKRSFEIDTEIMFALLRKKLCETNDYYQSIKEIDEKVLGTISTALMLGDTQDFILYTNNGSLYSVTNYEDIFIFASEKAIIEKLMKQSKNKDLFGNLGVAQVCSKTGYIINLRDFVINKFDLNNEVSFNSKPKFIPKHKFEISNYHSKKTQLHAVIDTKTFARVGDHLLQYNIDEIKNLRRCTKCILPETFPFIEFDEAGVCNFCKNYTYKNKSKPTEELLRLIEPFKNRNGEPDCLVPFSGGRDSTFIIHFVKKELGLNPIAFTYDWGMVTDLARRNIARVCGKLGIENIIVSADITKKRRFIKKNIESWLKKPSLGMIPLFMAGDKYFFKYANQVVKQNNIKLQIWGFNFLENTDFKVGFANVPPDWDKKMIYSMNFSRQLKLFNYVIKNIILNPFYLNSSIFDTLGSFVSRYFNPRRNYHHFFDYYTWDEKEIENVLFSEYHWETANDLSSTWRIGDGTASFYNYIYYTVAGFSEFDTFRSNQVREGMIEREEAFKLAAEENKPRYESLRWYLEIIGLDFKEVIKKVNEIPKLYR